MLTVVAGPCGAGKTHWIGQQMIAQKDAKPLVYISPATVGVDACRLCLNVPQLQVERDLPDTNQAVKQAAEEQTIYLELGYYLSSDLPELAHIPHRQVAVVGPDYVGGSDWVRSGWEQWADEVVTNVPASSTPLSESAIIEPGITDSKTDIWQASLRGQVLDPASLHTFWQELVQGAYGEMIRAKAIFELADGDAIYVDHLPQQETTYQDLPLPKWLNGRPQRFSGIEMVGQGLDKAAIAATLKDCCLDDSTLASHQAAIQQS